METLNPVIIARPKMTPTKLNGEDLLLVLVVDVGEIEVVVEEVVEVDVGVVVVGTGLRGVSVITVELVPAVMLLTASTI